jgi:hypothetical protein
MAADRPKRPRDPNQLAHMMVGLATGQISDPEPPKRNPAAVALGSLGGHARKAKLSKKRRSEIASKAVRARWAKSRTKSSSKRKS